MKRVIIFLSVFLLFSLEGRGQVVSLPDSNFVRFLKMNYRSTLNSSNGLIISEAAKIKGAMVCVGLSIHDIQGIQYFTKVTSIDLSNNQITALPDFLPNDSLQILTVNNNLLVQLPDFSLCTRFRSLDIVQNRLIQLNGIEKNKGLQQLICNGNLLVQLPVLDSLPNLVALDASYNQLRQFPVIGSHHSLQILHLNDNLLTSLPDSLDLPQLEKMWLYDNQLSFSQLLKLTKFKGYDTVFVVSPQLRLNEGKEVQAKEYASFTLSCHTDSGLASTSFTWYKNGTIYQTGQALSFSKATTSMSGKYVCAIRNSTFNQLTLRTDTFYVTILPCIDFSMISYTTVGVNCKRSGQVIVQDKSLQLVRYTLKSVATTHQYTSSNGLFSGLEEPSYLLVLQDVNGCEREYPMEIKVPKEACKQALITPNGDGESDSYFFTHTGSVIIYDKRGEIVKILSIPNDWDGAAKNGRVAPGAYLADINNGEELMNISVVY